MIELNVQSVKEFSYSPFRSLSQKREIFRESIIYVFDRFESSKVFTSLFCRRNTMEFRFSFHRRNRCEGPRVSSFTKGEIFEISTVTNINSRHLEMDIEMALRRGRLSRGTKMFTSKSFINGSVNVRENIPTPFLACFSNIDN